MKKYFCPLLALMFFSSSILYSQGNDTTYKNSLQKKSWAVQFAVGSNFQLTSFQGLMFSLKYHMKDRFALRFGVSFSGDLNNETFERTTYGNPTISKPLTRNNQDVRAVCSFLFYPAPKALINIYLGIGPKFVFRHSLYEELNSSSCGDYTNTYKTTSWQAGLEGTFGAEWFPVKILSIFAEYSAYGVYGKTIEDNNGYSCSTGSWHEKNNSEDWHFDGNTARMGLSVYF